MKNKTLKNTTYILFLLAVVFLFAFVAEAADMKQMPSKTSWGRDPFTAAELDLVTVDTVIDSPVEPEEIEIIETKYMLSGILTRGERQVAIMNGQLVREGDELEGGTIVRIEQDQVVVSQHNKERIVRMGAV